MKHDKLLTSRRQVVLDAIEESKEPLSPAAIHAKVYQKVGRISLATVYRTLKQLGDESIVRRIVLPTGEFHYESPRRESYRGYSFCRKCGKLSMLKFDHKEHPLEKVSLKGFQVEFQERLCFGLCRECLR